MHPSASYDGSVRQVEALAEDVSLTLRIARALLEAGRDVELHGLEDAVGLLCARALDLPADLGAPLCARLIALRGDSDALTTTLARRDASPA